MASPALFGYKLAALLSRKLSRKVGLRVASFLGRAISIIDKKKVFISCAKDDLELIEVQMENKSRMLTSEWIKGAQIKTGDYFG